MRSRDVACAGFEQTLIDHRVDAGSDLWICKRRELSVGIFSRAWNDARELFCECFANLVGMAWHPNRGCIHTRTPAVFSNRSDEHVEILFPVVDAILTNDYLAVTWTMNLNSRIVRPNGRGRTVAKQQRAAAVSQNLTRTCVIRRVETESLLRCARFDQRLNDSIRRPWLGTARFQHKRNAQRERGDPKRMYARRIVW